MLWFTFNHCGTLMFVVVVEHNIAKHKSSVRQKIGIKHTLGTIRSLHIEAGRPHSVLSVELWYKMLLWYWLSIIKNSMTWLYSYVVFILTILSIYMVFPLYQKHLLDCLFLCLFLYTMLYLASNVIVSFPYS